jgi:hypothetical protein
MTTHLHIVPRLRMSGAIPPLRQYAFMTWYSKKHRDDFTFYLYSLLFCILFLIGFDVYVMQSQTYCCKVNGTKDTTERIHKVKNYFSLYNVKYSPQRKVYQVL